MAKKLGRAGIKFLLAGLVDIFQKIADAVKTVNGEGPDENGDIQLTTVPFAQNLESESSQRNSGTFIQRMAGGDASLGNGDAWLLNIRGTAQHEGYVAEVIDGQVISAEEDPITISIDRAAFIAAFPVSGTLVLEYTTDWSENPSVYGITVTGTPVNGDEIQVVYVEEERGEITVCNPDSLIVTGWNLYDNTLGYAKVIKYTAGYRVEGTYTDLKWSATVDGEQSDITVTDGNFDIPADGYVWVNGGNSEDTVVYATWQDWTEGCPAYTGYSQTVVNLADVMASKFPYGLLVAGSAVDEIDLNLGQAISRVERLAYSEVNRALAEASGREFDFDEENIYLARANPIISSVTIDGSFQATDHGIEYFTGTDSPVVAELLYGNNLKNKLERNVLTVSPQTLTDSQKSQVQQNIGVTDALSSLLVVEKKQLFDNTTVSADGFISSEYTFTGKTGYTASGIVGVEIRNATNNGVGSSFASYNMCYLRNSLTAYVQMRNNSQNAAKLQMNIYVQFMKNLT